MTLTLCTERQQAWAQRAILVHVYKALSQGQASNHKEQTMIMRNDYEGHYTVVTDLVARGRIARGAGIARGRHAGVAGHGGRVGARHGRRIAGGNVAGGAHGVGGSGRHGGRDVADANDSWGSLRRGENAERPERQKGTERKIGKIK